jgi:hypothetical protein
LGQISPEKMTKSSSKWTEFWELHFLVELFWKNVGVKLNFAVFPPNWSPGHTAET